MTECARLPALRLMAGDRRDLLSSGQGRGPILPLCAEFLFHFFKQNLLIGGQFLRDLLVH